MIERTIPVDKIESTSNRENGGDGDIKILAEDIKHNGLINPVTVKHRISPGKDGLVEDFILVAGRRRVAAARLLGWKEIPSRILEDNEVDLADEIALSENVNRLAMHPLDEAEIFRRLLEAGEPVRDIAKRYDRTASAIWQRVQLLDLSPDIREMFREGKLDLHSAAMLKSLDEKEQAEFVKAKKDYRFINSYAVLSFIQGMHNDEVYKFLGKDCGKCKTRTFFTEKSLFPETDIDRDYCLNHGCYVQQWTKLLESRVKSLKGEHESHAAASRIVFTYGLNLEKILGRSVTIDGTEYAIAELDWTSSFSDTGGAGAEPCIFVSADGVKLKVEPAYRKAAKETDNLKDFSAELKLLDLPKEEGAAVRAALKARKIDHFNFTQKVRERVLSRLIAARAAELDADRGDAGLVLADAFRAPSKKAKHIFNLFTGKEYAGSTEEVLKLGDTAVFALLYALSLSEYDIPTVWSDKADLKERTASRGNQKTVPGRNPRPAPEAEGGESAGKGEETAMMKKVIEKLEKVKSFFDKAYQFSHEEGIDNKPLKERIDMLEEALAKLKALPRWETPRRMPYKNLTDALQYMDKAISAIEGVTFRGRDEQKRIETAVDRIECAKGAVETLIPLPLLRWETPEQWEKRTGDPWPDVGAVYALYEKNDGEREWYGQSWDFTKNQQKKKNSNIMAVVIATEAGPPPDDWKPDEGKD
jgi:ParB family chromosome partitioning protein